MSTRLDSTESGDVATGLDLSSLTTLHRVGIALAALSGVVHLVLGIASLPSAFGLSFLVAAAGFAVGIVLVAWNVRRRLVYQVGIPFVLGQIAIFGVLWVQGATDLSAVAAVDKLAQLVLVGVLVTLLRRE
ncbi:hypothetical protein [Halogeometricum limi]|uniref:Uncharacterized protein n=1 Tax=Halogeometricum limi TaxID=555875 RepID=A0A1I6FSW2_9EURY|nr:hypothetical protein [Halogeometricum limi]SFR32996.1 hypothetical protein SAMN04488124_0222 [Halogeometricum limi]